MKAIYLERWSDKQDVANDFSVELGKDIHILVACYTYEDYSGNAFVLFEKDNKLFEVNGSHCSCNGLEGQWEPEEVSHAELKHRVKEGNLGRWFAGSEDEILVAAAKVARMRKFTN